MPSFGWRELALLVVVLFALTALLRSGDSSADPRHLAASGAPDSAAAPEAATSSKSPNSTKSPTIAATASRGVFPVEKSAVSPRAVSPRPAVVPRDDEARRTRSAPAPRTASPEPVRSAATSATPVAPVTAPVPTPAETFWVGCANPAGFVGDGRIFFPLPGAHLGSYGDTWGAPRPQGGHEGTDLMVPAGTPELAVTDGTLVQVAGSNANGWNSLGGYAVMLRADYSIGPIKAGDLFYYAHLNARSQLPIGARVRAGEVLGYAGDTGQGPEVTRGLFPPHLHFGWYDGGAAGATRSAVPSGAINPYAMLEWIKANGDAGGSDAGLCAAPGVGAPVPAAPPATGDRWPADDSPGVGPDLDTGSGNPNPAPAPGAHKAAPHRAAGGAKTETPARQDPRKGKRPAREAAEPKPGAGTSGREPSAPATAAPSPTKPPVRPNPGRPNQRSQISKPAKPEPPGETDSGGSGAGRPGGQEPGAADPPKPVRSTPPIPGEVPPTRQGSPPDIVREIERTVGTIPDASTGPDPGTSIPDLPPGEHEEDRGRGEGRGATTPEGDAEEGPVEVTGSAEPAEEEG